MTPSIAVLYQVPPACGLLSVSPYCAKVQLALKLKAVPYRVIDTPFAGSNPRGKLPYLVWGERRLEDSTAIVEVLDAEGLGPKLIPSDPKLRAEADLLEDWADESLYWHGVAAKFLDPENWSRFRSHFGTILPAAIRPLAIFFGRRGLLAKLAAQGMSRRDPQLVRREFSRHLDSLETRLDGRTWLVGEQLSIADVAVTAMLWQLLPDYAPWHAAQVAARTRLSALMLAVRAEAERRAAS